MAQRTASVEPYKITTWDFLEHLFCFFCERSFFCFVKKKKAGSYLSPLYSAFFFDLNMFVDYYSRCCLFESFC